MRLNEIVRSKRITEAYFDYDAHPDAPSPSESERKDYVASKLSEVEKQIIEDYFHFKNSDTFKYCTDKFAWFPEREDFIMHDYSILVKNGVKKYLDASNYKQQYNILLGAIKRILRSQTTYEVDINDTILKNNVLEDNDIWSLLIFKNHDVMNEINKIMDHTLGFCNYHITSETQCSEQDAKQFVQDQIRMMHLFMSMLNKKEYQTFYDFMDGEAGLKEIFREIGDNDEYEGYLDSLRGEI